MECYYPVVMKGFLHKNFSWDEKCEVGYRIISRQYSAGSAPKGIIFDEPSWIFICLEAKSSVDVLAHIILVQHKKIKITNFRSKSSKYYQKMIYSSLSSLIH